MSTLPAALDRILAFHQVGNLTPAGGWYPSFSKSGQGNPTLFAFFSMPVA